MDKNEELWLVYSTFPHREEALSISRKLLEQQLIACANIIPSITSLYHWQGNLCEETEVILIAKTTASKRHQAMQTIIQLHSYDIPCVVMFPLAEVAPDFLRWVGQQCANQ